MSDHFRILHERVCHIVKTRYFFTRRWLNHLRFFIHWPDTLCKKDCFLKIFIQSHLIYIQPHVICIQSHLVCFQSYSVILFAFSYILFKEKSHSESFYEKGAFEFFAKCTGNHRLKAEGLFIYVSLWILPKF